jgi:hypothetical protein
MRQAIPFSLDFQRAETQNGPNRLSRLIATQNKFGTLPFRVSAIRISGCATTGGLAPRFPRSRNSETPNSKHAPLFRGFLHRDFGMCDDRRSRTWVSREPKLETPNSKHAPLFLGFLHRDFGMCDDRRSHTWVSWELKL